VGARPPALGPPGLESADACIGRRPRRRRRNGFERGLQTTVQAMPNVTFQDKLERMRAWATGMHGYVAPG
jgi:hypothetical protein